MAEKKFTPADFDPSLKPYDNIPFLRFWCQKVLPAVYDQSLSYYEALCKMGAFLNKMLEELEKMQDNIDALHEAFVKLQAWVNAEIERFETDMENRFNEFKQEIYDLFEQYKEEADTYINEQLNKYKTETTEWLSQKFEEYKTQANQYIDQIFQQYKNETNQEFNEWKQEFTNQYNEWKSQVDQSISNLGDRVTNIEGDISEINSQIDNLEQIVTQNFPKFELKSVRGTGSKYYQYCIIDFLSFPSDADSHVLCYGILRTFGQAESVSVSGNWRERFTFTASDIQDIKTRLGWSNENCLKLELMPRASYVSAAGDINNGAPTNSTPIMSLLWIDTTANNQGQMFVRNNGSVGFVSDVSYLFSAILTDQSNPPTWSLASGEWSN